jgi:L-sorbose 1-phosphate reductase
MPGGAGAMGQMHVQLALESLHPPRTVIVTDLDTKRLQKLRERLGNLAEKAGVNFITLNPNEYDSADAFAEQLMEETHGKGCDDIVMLVPVPAVISDAVKYLAADGLMNIFAGIPAGKKAHFSLAGITQKGHRFIASSGSGMDDIRHTLEMTETGKLSPVYALAAIGGMNSLKEGVQGVIDARFPGKTVIYPHAVEMPLVAIEEVEQLCSGASATLNKDGVLTHETEKKIRAEWEK